MALRYDNGALATLSSTMLTYGSNTATIMGTRGKLVIQAPFYYPEKITITRFPDTSQMQPTPKETMATGLKQQIKEKLRASPLVKRLRLFKPNSGESLIRVEPGSGYHHQAVEVGRCLRGGLMESPLMPWAETLQVLEVLDTLRQSWNLSYPQDEH